MTVEIGSFEKFEFPGMEPELRHLLSPDVQRIYRSAGKNTLISSKSRHAKDLGVVPFSGLDGLVPKQNNKMEPPLINTGVQKT